jgi:hypothetical protein
MIVDVESGCKNENQSSLGISFWDDIERDNTLKVGKKPVGISK